MVSVMKNILNRGLIAISKIMPAHLVGHWLFLLRQHPQITDRWGYHVRPIHYYEPLPDFHHITPEQITRKREYLGIDFNIKGQVELFEHLGKAYKHEIDELASEKSSEGFNFQNDYFAGIDAALYYSLIRYLKPKQIIEIGSGYSTRIAAKAVGQNMNEGTRGYLACIEPYPQPRLLEANLPIELVQKKVEDVSSDFFSRLSSNDILFIDSSHVARFGSDVCYEILEILPKLPKGVWIHIHDIFFPHDYPVDWLINKRIAFNEQYLLEAFLSFNNSFKVKAANYWLSLYHSDVVDWLYPLSKSKDEHLGRGSFWMCKID